MTLDIRFRDVYHQKFERNFFVSIVQGPQLLRFPPRGFCHVWDYDGRAWISSFQIPSGPLQEIHTTWPSKNSFDAWSLEGTLTPGHELSTAFAELLKGRHRLEEGTPQQLPHYDPH